MSGHSARRIPDPPSPTTGLLLILGAVAIAEFTAAAALALAGDGALAGLSVGMFLACAGAVLARFA